MGINRANHISIICVLILVGLFISCQDQGDEITAPIPPPADVVSWNDVSPIFQSECVSCHGGSGGLYLDTYANAIAGGNFGAVIIPGDADNSLLYQLLEGSAQGLPQMPQGGSISNNNKKTIEDWIDDGALESPPE